MRKLTAMEIVHFNYLNNLRDSGVTNMFGASPYLQEEFGLSKQEASESLTLWMNNFKEDPLEYNDLQVKA